MYYKVVDWRGLETQLKAKSVPLKIAQNDFNWGKKPQTNCVIQFSAGVDIVYTSNCRMPIWILSFNETQAQAYRKDGKTIFNLTIEKRATTSDNFRVKTTYLQENALFYILVFVDAGCDGCREPLVQVGFLWEGDDLSNALLTEMTHCVWCDRLPRPFCLIFTLIIIIDQKAPWQLLPRSEVEAFKGEKYRECCLKIKTPAWNYVPADPLVSSTLPSNRLHYYNRIIFEPGLCLTSWIT